jgi:asparagine synthase (glutamine-hydrolysing)
VLWSFASLEPIGFAIASCKTHAEREGLSQPKLKARTRTTAEPTVEKPVRVRDDSRCQVYVCGIAGFVRMKSGHSPPPKSAEELVQALRHRGPDDIGVHGNSAGAIAQTRLSIIDVEGGHQPMPGEDESTWIAYNGETYNFLQLQKLLRDHKLRTRSDTEVVLRLYEEQGPSCLTFLDGMFAFAILDKNNLFLARDPLGVKPLYYTQRDSWLYFASEIKALLPLENPIYEFPSGHWFHSAKGFQKYFVFEDWINNRELANPVGALKTALKSAVEKRLVADVPVGVFLSGGLDSSLVAALMRPHVNELHSFVVGMEGSEDLKYARRAAEFLKTTHHERVYTESDMREVIEEVVYRLESFDFALVRSAVANYFVSKLASEFLKVVLVGEGSDEIFGGYHYLKSLSKEQLSKELIRITMALHNSNLQRLDRMTMAHGLEGREPYLDLNLLKVAFQTPLELKQKHGIEKWALRKAFEGLLPDEILWRTKEKFSRGTGSALVFESIAESEISDREFEQERRLRTGFTIRSKEELYYYRLFQRQYPESVTECLGWTREPGKR